MFKPKLKQSVIPALTATKSINNKPSLRETKAEDQAYGLLMPKKLLEPSTLKNKSKITAPLLVLPHKYPKIVQEVLESNQQNLDSANRGIGAFKDINWFFHDRKIIFWRTGMQAAQSEQVEKPIDSVSIGFIGNKISQRRLGGIVVAVAIANKFTVYSLNEHTLKFKETRQAFEVDYTLQIRRVQWTSDGILMVAGDQYTLQYHSWAGQHSVIKSQIPLYRRLLPIAIFFAADSAARQIHNILPTRNRVYVHVKEVREKSWLRAKVDEALQEDANKYKEDGHIEVFSLDKLNKSMKFQRIIRESDLLNRLRVDKPQAKTAKVKAIYLDFNADGEQQLGIVTESGYFLTLRNSQQTYFSKQCQIIPPAAHFGDIMLIASHRPQIVTQEVGKPVEVIASLGFSSLTLTSQALYWIGANRIDGIRAEQIFGQLYFRQDKKCENPLFRENQWALYSYKEYYTVKQLPLRHLVGAFLFQNIPKVSNGLVIQANSIRLMEQRLISAITPSKYIQALIQLIAIGQDSFSIDDTILQIIRRELRKEISKDFRNTPHQIRTNVQIYEIAINDRLAIEAWNSLIKIYLGSNSQPLQSPYWIAIKNSFYGLVSQLFSFEPSDFLEKRNFIADVSSALTSLSNFIDKRIVLQNKIRNTLLNKNKQNVQEINSIWLSSSMAEQLAINRVSSELLTLEEHIKYGIRTTIALMSIFFSLADSDSKIRFGKLLSDDKEQHALRLLLLKRQSLNDLQHIHKNLPQLELNIDVSCINTLNRLQKEPTEEQITQIASILNSYHFSLCFRKITTPKLQIRLLLKYQANLINQNTSMVKENSLVQRTILIHSLFPEDDSTKLKIRRQRIQSELIIIRSEISRIIETTAKKFKDDQNKNNEHQLNEAAIEICERPEFMNQLKFLLNDFKLDDKYLQLEKIGSLHGRRELFPHPVANKSAA